MAIDIHICIYMHSSYQSQTIKQNNIQVSQMLKKDYNINICLSITYLSVIHTLDRQEIEEITQVPTCIFIWEK